MRLLTLLAIVAIIATGSNNTEEGGTYYRNSSIDNKPKLINLHHRLVFIGAFLLVASFRLR